ncbi:recombinase family protein [Roseofilum casamattae]|uniref:Recombinase family protein n=1 Tax=Roseofilum casamattae BLCC-M143 TaxID=3022442 RepID=A0ABT7BVM6_9CYAN|nr:recombinase family protein [Roseofilum casamattae BLCC-M143]
MTIFAYMWCDPLLEAPPDPQIWGWEVDRIYQDLGQRDRWQQLLQDIETQETRAPVYLLVRQLAELGDSAQEVSDRLRHLEELQVNIIAIKETDPPSEVTHRDELLQLFQHLQTHYRSLRIRQGHARNRLQAKPPPGKAPYGYKRGKSAYILDRSCAPVVKDFFEHFLLYGSIRGAVRYLEKKYRKKIGVTTGRRWLTNPVYRGDTAFKDGEIISDTHTPILSREEAAQIDRLLRRNRRLPPRSASAPRSLAGLVRCQQCQSGMKISRVTRHRKSGEYLYLHPISCPLQPKCKGLRYEEVLQGTIDRICQDLQQAVSGLSLPDLDRIKAEVNREITNNNYILDQLPQLVETGILDPETAELRAYKLRTEIATLRSRLSALPPVNLTSVARSVSLPQFWLDLSEAERRFYFREFIREIQVICLPDREKGDRNWQLKLIFIF